MEKLVPVENNVLLMYCLEDEDGKLNTSNWDVPVMSIALRKNPIRTFIGKFLNMAVNDPSIKTLNIDQALKWYLPYWVKKKRDVGTNYWVKQDIMPMLCNCLNSENGLELVIIVPELQFMYDELIITGENIGNKNRFSLKQIKANHQSTFTNIPGLPNHKILYLCSKQKIQNLYVYSVLHKLCNKKSFWNKLKFWK